MGKKKDSKRNKCKKKWRIDRENLMDVVRAIVVKVVVEVIERWM